MRKPFDFRDLDKLKNRFTYPDWYKTYWMFDEDSRKYWEWQYDLYKRGEPYVLPEWTLRQKPSEVHQLMSKDFYNEVPKDFHSILDLGCSDGYMVKYIQDDGKDVIGVNDMLFPTDRIFIEESKINVQEMDMHNLSFPNETFDAVWCRHVLEHSFAPMIVLAEIYRTLKPNGYLFIVLPPPPNPPGAYHGHWHQIPDYQLEYLLQMCNFVVLSMKIAYFTYETENDNSEIRAICRSAKSPQECERSLTQPDPSQAPSSERS